MAATYLQRTVDRLIPWYAEWRITINAKKTNAVFFSASAKTQLPGEILVDTEETPWKENALYLGVQLDRGLSFRKHALYVAQRARTRRFHLAPLLHSKFLSLETKKKMYIMAIRPILSYAAPAWSGRIQQT